MVEFAQTVHHRRLHILAHGAAAHHVRAADPHAVHFQIQRIHPPASPPPRSSIFFPPPPPACSLLAPPCAPPPLSPHRQQTGFPPCCARRGARHRAGKAADRCA